MVHRELQDVLLVGLTTALSNPPTRGTFEVRPVLVPGDQCVRQEWPLANRTKSFGNLVHVSLLTGKKIRRKWLMCVYFPRFSFVNSYY